MTAAAARALVLEASTPRRVRFQRVLQDSGRVQAVGGAANAEQALALIAQQRAQVVLLGHSGNTKQALGWVRQIMQNRPVPIVVVCAHKSADDADVFELLSAGAVSVLHEPPAGGPGFADSQMDLLQTLSLMSEVKVVRRWPRAAGALASPAATAPAPLRAARGPVDVVAIGVSTGGPAVLQVILSELPRTFALPIVVVQHMADGFVQGLADWLAASCPLRIEIARAGTPMEPGRVYLAPDHAHLQVGADRSLVLHGGEPVNGHRPAVSELFSSVARHFGPRAVGVLLTGMGKDGAAELKQMKDAGAITMAQDRESSVVHGMPGEAIRIGAASYVMSPQEIAVALPAFATR